ncbi:YbgA family protein [Yersinia sp. Marseille-Q3913]|uniref:YbgA family protein n=1 Tax=Yersinia sp. Marseille-Q3913 TaxID=2830769 RepID=UPI001BAF47D1|nr:YbgA family protein [Yersinia sp. Marseille-Q3913]MBS0056857.1 YbgA family protein [Yersinia sp. Marseille-Q3913]
MPQSNQAMHSSEYCYVRDELDALCLTGISRGKLMAFHSRYKLVLLAHSQPEYREIGPFIASMDKWSSLIDFSAEYRQRLLHLLSHQPTTANHTNVLMHVQGYFRPHLNSPQRQALAQLIDQYRLGELPLSAPVAQLMTYLIEFPNDYLSGQHYFSFYSPQG